MIDMTNAAAAKGPLTEASQTVEGCITRVIRMQEIIFETRCRLYGHPPPKPVDPREATSPSVEGLARTLNVLVSGLDEQINTLFDLVRDFEDIAR